MVINALNKDVEALKALLSGSEVDIIGIPSTTPSICAVFGNAEEARPSEFSIMKSFATDNGYHFTEDRDTKNTPGGGKVLHYYIFSLDDAPF